MPLIEPDPDSNEKEETLARHIKGLSKHFEAVLIIGSWMTPEGATRIMMDGHGNHFARIEMARHFVKKHDHAELAAAIGDHIGTYPIDPDDDPDEGEEEKD